MSVVEQRDISNSSSSAIIRNRASAIDDKIKVNRLDIYHENRDELNAWLIQMKIYFQFNDVSRKKRTLFAIIYLREKAQRWMQFRLIEYLNDDDENENEMFDDFNFFEKELKKIFDIFNEEQTAERIIQHVKQRISASDYAVRF